MKKQTPGGDICLGSFQRRLTCKNKRLKTQTHKAEVSGNVVRHYFYGLYSYDVYSLKYWKRFGKYVSLFY